MDATNLANGSKTAKRRELDFYPTPSDCTVALIDFLNIPHGQTVWERACGDGAMSKVFHTRGYRVISTDIEARGYGESPVNFLTCQDRGADWIVTNPPFNLSGQFITRAHALARHGFAMLLKSQYWHAKKRLSLFREMPPSHVLPLTWRPDFMGGERGGSPTMECVWTVWRHGQTDTRYTPLERLSA